MDDEGALGQALRTSAPSEVYNLAGVSSVALSWEQPALTATVNGTFVARLLELVRQEQERRGEQIAFVQASSAEIFGDAATAPQDETTPMSPRSPYGASKAFAHNQVQVFRARGMHASNAILYNHESPRRPTSFVTRKITSTVAAISLVGLRRWSWGTSTRGGTGAGRRSTSTRWCGWPGTPQALMWWSPPGWRTRWRTSSRRRSRGWGSPTGRAWSRRARRSSVRWTPWSWWGARRARELLGWEPQVNFEELVGRMVDADLAALH